MNIFVLDENPTQAAKWHNDTHSVKMILETAQMLCSVHHVHKTNITNQIYRLTHQNHPCNVWARTNTANYEWLCVLGNSLCNEYTERYGKIHKSQSMIELCSNNIPNSLSKSLSTTNFALAIREEIFDFCYVKNNPVQSYRNFYLLDKRGGKHETWKQNKPSWWIDSLDDAKKFIRSTNQ